MARTAAVQILITGKNLVGRVFSTVEHQAKSMAARVKGAFTGIQGAVAGLGVSLGAAGLLRYLYSANAQFQQLIARLETFTGSADKAKGVFDDLSHFAATTPFELAEVVEAFITLRSAGIQPTGETLTRLGDQAAAFGGRIEDMAEAVRAATTGEMERLKRFGVVARLEGDKITATFRGQETVLKRNAVEITNYLETLSKNNFAGAMARQMDTLGGATANLQDAFFRLATQVGEGGFSKELTKAIQGVTRLVEEIQAAPEVFRWATGAIIATIKAVASTFWNLVTIAFRVGNLIGLGFKVAFGLVRLGATVMLRDIAERFNLVLDVIDKIPGVDLGFRLPDFKQATEDAKRFYEEVDAGVKNTFLDTVRDFQDIGDAWIGALKSTFVGPAKEIGKEAAKDVVDGLKDGGLATGEGTLGKGDPKDLTSRNLAPKDLTREGADAAAQQAMIAAANLGGASLAMQGAGGFRGRGKSPVLQMFEEMTMGADEATRAVKMLGSEIDYLTAHTIVAFSDQWVGAFQAIGEGQGDLAGAIVGSAKHAIGATAGMKAKETALDAAKALAEGLTNPAKLLQAAKLFAVSAGYAALSGLLGGGGGSRGGGSAGSRESRARDANDLNGAAGGRGAGVIQILGGTINLNDHRQREEFEDAVNDMIRFGRVQIMPAPGR